MKLGYFAMPLHGPERAPADWLEDDLRQIEVLDRLGYIEAWIGEHNVTPWEPMAAPELFIAAALQRTTNIRMGTGISQLPHHHPVQLANRIATLDQMARGRFNWGIGTSGFHESEVFNIDWRANEHRQMFRDVLDAVLELWDDPPAGPRRRGRLDYTVIDPVPPLSGFHLTPYQKPHPPIGVACVTPTSDSLVLAGERGWIPMSLSLLPESALILNWETYARGVAAARRSASRDIWRISREVFVGETSAQARELALEGPIARSWREAALPTAQRAGLPIAVLTGPDAGVDYDDMDGLLEWFCDNVWIVGDVDDVVVKLNALNNSVGGFGTLLVIAQDWESELWERSVTLLMQEVLPRVEDVRESALA